MGTPYQTGSLLGADFNNANSTQQFAVGTRALGSQDTLFVYLQCAETLSTGSLVYLTTAGTGMLMLTSSPAFTSAQLIGFVQTAFTSSQYGWAAVNGNAVYVRVSGTCSRSATLYTASGGGLLSTTEGDASGTLIGVVLLNSTSAAASAGAAVAAVANLTWPRFVWP